MTDETKKLEEALRNSFVKIEKLRDKVVELENLKSEPIAIIGMACRLPGNVNNPDDFWNLLIQNKDAIIDVPSSRWSLDQYYDPDKNAPGKMYVKKGGFLQSSIEEFDADFFHISPKEAEDMDPQQRLALEVAVEAIQNAGLNSADLMRSLTGVYMGICFNDYGHLITESGHTEAVDNYYSTGNHYSVLSGRISYFFGLQGPAISMDTACSSSLVTLDAAVKDLRLKRCNLALAGGVNLMLAPEPTINFCKSGMLSPEGHCKTFDESADGYVRGEGCGILILKRLSDALKDNNTILAVIRGTAVNQDGPSSGLTVPNGLAQEAVIKSALENAKVSPQEIQYVEAHGTGTSLGDPIEVEALKNSYTQERDKNNPLRVGSVKTNIGHTEAVAGVASVMKVVLSFLHEKIPATLHFKKLNPKITLGQAPLEIASQNIDWKRAENKKRLAGVSSFGFSGTNAHVIIEEGPKLSEQELSKLKERALQAHPFNRKKYYAESLRVKKSPFFGDDPLHPLLGIRIDSPYKDIIFEQIVSLDALPYLADHVVYDSVILPGAGFVELMEAALFHLEGAPCQLKDVRIERPLLFKANTQYLLQVIASLNEKTWSFSVYSKIYDKTERPWISHASASGEALEEINEVPTVSPKRLENIAEIIQQKTPDVDYYDAFWKLGYRYGKDFRGLKGITEEGGEYWGFVVAPDSLSLEKNLFHPALLDIAFHTLIATSLHLYKDNPFLPISFDSVTFYKPFSRKVWVKIIPQVSSSDEIIINDCIFFDELGECCAVINGFSLKKATPEALKKLLHEEKEEANWLYHIVWEPKNLAEDDKISDAGSCLILSTIENNEIFTQKFKDDFSSEIIKVDIQQSLSSKVLEAINGKKYSTLVLLIDRADDLMLSAPNLNKNGILFLLSLAQALKIHPKTRVFIANIRNSLSGLLLNSFCRCWRLEESERPIKYIQFEENELSAVVGNIVSEILSDNSDNEIHYEKNKRLTSRLQHMASNAPSDSEVTFSPDANYIITGGLGGLGLTLAKWCAQHGAKNLILCGRRKPDSDAQTIIQQLTAEGANINVQSIDLSNREQVNQLVHSANQSAQPLKGIFHLAGVIEQGLIESQTPEMLEKVFAPKALGAWYLHEVTRDLNLDYFILFSSISSGLGAPGGSNYAVANAFLDALALHRRAQGLVANSVQWGPWGEVGMMKQLSEAQQIPGLIKMPPLKALNALQNSLCVNTEGISLIANINWAEIPKRMPTQPLWESFIPKEKSATGNLLSRLLSLDSDERLNYMKIFLRNVLKDIFKLQEISPEMDGRGFFELGMDSLMSIDFYNQLSEAVGKENKLSYTLAYDHPNINALAEYLMSALALKEKAKLRVSARIQESELDQIAVIGMACRFPGGANSPEEYWNVLKKEKSINRIIPSERWDADLYYDPDREKDGKMYAKSGHFLNFPIDRFDSEFFHISPREAESIDPQQRLLMELSWELFENAGIDPLKLRGSQTGVFIGLMTQDYYSLLARGGGIKAINKFMGVGVDFLGGPGRLSFYYGFRGPSAPVLTACSSSLAATHLGVLSLQRGESDLVLAGGVNLILDPFYMVTLSKMGLLSPDGLSKTFDKTADGYGRGEGCGLVLLKRLKDAERDQDNILAVIRGTAMNHNGPSSGLTVPSSQAQQEVYLSALSAAKISPEKISFVESHGTGTALGDPIEVGSIKEIYGNPGRKNPLWIGAVKSNIGHLEGAAGISSLIKAILCLQHKEIPPQNHFQNLNPGIDLASIPAKLPTEVVKWEGVDGQFVAAVSSFGATGVNAHAIIESAQEKLENEVPGLKFPLHILAFSAYTQKALDELLEKYQDYLAETEENLDNIAYSMNVGRSQFKHRIAVFAKDKTELLDKLKRKDWVKSEEAISSEIHLEFEFTDKKDFTLLEESRTRHKIIIGEDCDWTLLLSKIAEYFVQGVDINWQSFYSQSRVKKILLPHYPFQRKRYWAKVAEKYSAPQDETLSADISSSRDAIPKKNIDINLLLQKGSSEKNEKILLDFISGEVSQVAGLPADESVDVQKNFYEMGMDSLMLVNLTNRLQAAFENQLDVTVAIVFENPTVEQLALALQSRLSGQAKTPAKEMKLPTADEIMQSPGWITEIPGREKTQLRIFCFPHAGGGKSLFSSWREALPDFVSLCLVQLPGREERMHEPMILTPDQILSALVNHMKPYLDKPYVMVGHSFGSLLAYDVIAELERLSLPVPDQAFLSSFNPDQIKETKELGAIIQLPEEDFLKEIHDRFEGIPEFVWKDKNLQKIIFPALKGDVTYVANHPPISGKISTPIITLCGDSEGIKPQDMANWMKYTRGNYEHHTIPGGHFMISENQKEYLEFLISRLSLK